MGTTPRTGHAEAKTWPRCVILVALQLGRLGLGLPKKKSSKWGGVRGSEIFAKAKLVFTRTSFLIFFYCFARFHGGNSLLSFLSSRFGRPFLPTAEEGCSEPVDVTALTASAAAVSALPLLAIFLCCKSPGSVTPLPLRVPPI